jgi:hypothetical protein
MSFQLVKEAFVPYFFDIDEGWTPGRDRNSLHCDIQTDTRAHSAFNPMDIGSSFP